MFYFLNWDTIFYYCFGLFGDFFLYISPQVGSLPINVQFVVPITDSNLTRFFLLILFGIWFLSFLFIYTVALFLDILFRIYSCRNSHLKKYWFLFLYIIYELPDWLTEYAAFSIRKLAFKNMEPFIMRTLPEASIIKNRWLFLKITFISFLVSDILDLCKSQILFFRILGFFFRIFFDFFLIIYFLSYLLLLLIFFCLVNLRYLFFRILIEFLHLGFTLKKFVIALIIHPLFYYYFFGFFCRKLPNFNIITIFEYLRQLCRSKLTSHAYYFNLISTYRRWFFRVWLLFILIFVCICLICILIIYFYFFTILFGYII